MTTAINKTASAPGTRGSKDTKQSDDGARDLNFVDVILAVGIRPLAEFLKGRKTAIGAIMAVLAYATPLQEWAQGSDLESVLKLLVALLEFLAAWLGGGGLVSWLLASRRVGRLFV